MTQRGYLRQPSMRGDAIVFVCDDDLWRVDAGGGTARRLTAGLGEPATPCLSPDGKWLAYVGRDEQHPEVYLMPAEGGPARRMTWLGPDVIVRGWTPDGASCSSPRTGQPFFRNYRAFTLDVAGGCRSCCRWARSTIWRSAPARRWSSAATPPIPRAGSAIAAARPDTCGSTPSGSGNFRRMSELAGNITSPMWIGERVYFLSDAEGVGNLYSCRPDGYDLRRHTDHDDYYARNAQTDGKRIVYQCGADIWLFDPAQRQHGARRDRRAVASHAGRAQIRRPRRDHLGGFNVHPAGHSVAVDARGKLFTMALWEGAVRQHGVADGVRYRHRQWLADGETLVAVSDESGEERVQSW